MELMPNTECALIVRHSDGVDLANVKGNWAAASDVEYRKRVDGGSS